jgi:hypothetical protein
VKDRFDDAFIGAYVDLHSGVLVPAFIQKGIRFIIAGSEILPAREE